MAQEYNNGVHEMKLLTYVINLVSRPDRLAGFRHEAEKAGIDFKVLEAERPTTVPDDWKHGMGMWGCNTSHAILWAKLIASDADYMMVFEDDAVLSNAKHLADIESILTDYKPDILYLGGNYTAFGARKGVPDTDLPYLFHGGNTLTTHAYVISREAAEWAYKFTPWRTEAIDVAMFTLQNRGNSLCISPSIFTQRPGYSDIWQRETNYNHCVK
jgi:GR25 family glycosyltransferase involved in LPS biosynthesis